eukprot:GDKK01056424.1.p1 GENE.GDKK01056424.1~~GDKK01056424.1.p1  ORF type:complete len:540 (-),score=37.41 GDKK01056424.1:203-1822(-)
MGPPEVVRKEAISEKVDIWSLGCTVIEMLTGRFPFSEMVDKENSLSVFNFIRSAKEPLPIPADIADPVARDFISNCLRINPRDRPSTLELKSHPFLSYVDLIENDNVSIADSMYSLIGRPDTRMSIAPSMSPSILAGPHDPEAEQHVLTVRKNLRKFIGPPGLPLAPSRIERMDSSVLLVAGNRVGAGDGSGLLTYNPNSIHRMNPSIGPQGVPSAGAMSSSTLSANSMNVKFAPYKASAPAIVVKASTHAKTVNSIDMMLSDGDNRTAFSDGDGQSPLAGGIQHPGPPNAGFLQHPSLGFTGEYNPLVAPNSQSNPNSHSNPNSNTNSGGSATSGGNGGDSGPLPSYGNNMFPVPAYPQGPTARVPSPTMTTASRMTVLHFNDPEADELLAAIQQLSAAKPTKKGGEGEQRKTGGKGKTNSNVRLLGDSEDEADMVQELSPNGARTNRNRPHQRGRAAATVDDDAPSEIEVSDSDESDVDSYGHNNTMMDAMSLRTNKSGWGRRSKGRCSSKLMCQIGVGVGTAIVVIVIVVVLVLLL